MNVTIIGGTFGINEKASSIVNQICNEFNDDDTYVVNGGPIDMLPKELKFDLSIWMPNIDNEEEKHYPIKKQGSVLICSKVMREGYKDADAISRIFKMHGNAVIAIYKDKRPFTFRLIDALGNEWYNGSNIPDLVTAIKKFYKWTKEAVRINTIKDDSLTKEEHSNLAELIALNNKLAKFVQTSCGERFFGNISTRCQKLFPTASNTFGIYVSPRNSNKESLTPDDMVYMTSDMHYFGDKKPSVDSPCQITIYKNVPNIHYMIHGHAFIKGADTTNEYYLCGDVREADEVINIIKSNKNGFLNLKNHGFLIYAQTIEELRTIINSLITNAEFVYDRN